MTNDDRDKMLTEIHTSVVVIAERVEQHASELKKHNVILRGNGKDGLIVDVDRLKTYARTERWVYGTIFVVFLGILAKALYDRLAC